MAEAFVNKFSNGKYFAESAGIESGKLNPLVVDAMKEEGIDISQNKTKTVDEMLAQKKQFHFVITVCDKASAERCPVFPGNGKKLHWSFPDPSSFIGTDEEKIIFARKVRDSIKQRVYEFLNQTWKDFSHSTAFSSDEKILSGDFGVINHK